MTWEWILIALAIYLAPNFMNSKETRKIAQIKAMNAIFTAKTLEEFAKDTNAKPSDIAKKVADELMSLGVTAFINFSDGSLKYPSKRCIS